MKKKILIIVGSLVVVIVVAFVIVAANLNKIINSKKGELLARAKQQTGRDISIGDVGVTLWPGLGARVSDVVVGDDPAFGTGPFVRAKQLVVNVKLLPLLQQRVEIKRLVLDEPDIVIIKADATHFNFTSLIAAAAPPAAPGAKPAPNSSVAAVLAFADIKNGTLRYEDRVAHMDRTIHDIDFTASNVGIGEKLDAKLAAAVFGDKQDVKVEIAAGPLGDPANKEALRATPLDVKLELAPVALLDLMAGMPAKAGNAGKPAPQPIPGEVTATAEVSGTLGEATLKSLDVAATLLGAKNPNLKLSASGGPFDFTADSTLVFAHAILKGNLETEPIALSNFKMTSTDPKAPAPVLGGDVRASGSFEGNLMALSFNGSVDASNASIEQKDATGTISFVKKAGIPANATVKGTFHPQHTPGEGIDLEKIDIVFHALTASGTGRIVPFDGSPKSMQVSLDAKTALKPWNDLLPAMAPFAVSGDATANVHISSTMAPGAQPDITGTAHFRNLGAKMVDMPKSVTDGEGTASFTTKTANIQGAKFRIGESRFVMDCNVSSFTPMTATYKVTSDAVNGLDVQAPAPGAKPLPRPDVFKQVAASGSMKETAPTVVENNLVVSSKNGVVSNIDYTDFTAGVRMTPTTTTINSYSAKALGGAISGSGTMEPKTSKFDVSAKIENVNVAEYFRYKAPAFSDALVGRINADIQVAGEGKDWTAIQKNLTGKGGAVVLEGALNNMNIASQIVSSIQGLPMVPPDIAQRMKARNPKLFSETKTAFQNLSSKFQIANGKITTPDLKLVTSDFSLAGAGWFSLTKEMKLASTLTIAPKMANDLAAEVPAVKYIQGADGRIQVPLDLTGSVLKPTIKVDSADMTALFQKAMMSQGQQQVESQVQKGVKGLLDSFGKKKQPAKPATPPATPPAKPKTTPPDSTRG